jgi:hypothetical protein
MRRITRRFLGVSTMLMALFATLPGVAFAAQHIPFMPCCFNPVTLLAHNMACCIAQGIAMQLTCCGRFF